MSKIIRGRMVCFIADGNFDDRPRNRNEQQFQKNDPLLVIGTKKINDGRRDFLEIDVFNFRTRTFEKVVEQQVGTIFNAEYLDLMRGWHADQLQSIDKMDKCMKELEVGDIDANQFMLWNLDNIYTKNGASKKERLNILQDVLQELTAG